MFDVPEGDPLAGPPSSRHTDQARVASERGRGLCAKDVPVSLAGRRCEMEAEPARAALTSYAGGAVVVLLKGLFAMKRGA